jgi:hypothetical protein
VAGVVARDRVREKIKGLAPSQEIALIEKTNPRWLALSDEWEKQPKFHDRPWNTEEII